MPYDARVPDPARFPRSGVRERNLYDPASAEPFRLSRSKLEVFLQCARCFYLDRRRGIGRPEGPTMSLNTAVDALLKREFDGFRKRGERHPIMVREGIDALPWHHHVLEEWRENGRGMRVLHQPTRFLVHGALDDLWVTPRGELIVVDYKATSSERTPSLSGGPWSEGYKRQSETYQWLLRGLGYVVSPISYFVYVNGDRTRLSFDEQLLFSTTVIPYTGNTVWVDDALTEAKLCLDRQTPPSAHPTCPWCAYRSAALAAEHEVVQ